MFRVSQFIDEIFDPSAVGPRRDPPGPVVIWNLIRQCNLLCKHCYTISADKKFPGELTTEEVKAVMADLKAFHVPALILSGGEPLLRPDIFEISKHAVDMGFHTALSSNGTLIDEDVADKIAEIGYGYVGVSVDGIGETHNEFRRKENCFEEAMQGLRLCRDRDQKIGLRFTMTEDNAHELPDMLQLIEDEASTGSISLISIMRDAAITIARTMPYSRPHGAPWRSCSTRRLNGKSAVSARKS